MVYLTNEEYLAIFTEVVAAITHIAKVGGRTDNNWQPQSAIDLRNRLVAELVRHELELKRVGAP